MPAHSLAMLARRCALGVVCMHPSMSATMRVGSMCAAHPRSHVNVMRMFDRKFSQCTVVELLYQPLLKLSSLRGARGSL